MALCDEADAPLIAAAPELLEEEQAFVATVEACESDAYSGDWYDLCQEFACRSRVLIARATGAPTP